MPRRSSISAPATILFLMLLILLAYGAINEQAKDKISEATATVTRDVWDYLPKRNLPQPAETGSVWYFPIIRRDATPTPVLPPTATPLPPGAYWTKVKISWYWPNLGGPNCSNFVNGYCVARTASGQRWEKWVDKGIACPRDIPFGTRIIVEGREWVCVDRGGAINYVRPGLFWIDMLTQRAIYPYGTVRPALVIPGRL